MRKGNDIPVYSLLTELRKGASGVSMDTYDKLQDRIHTIEETKEIKSTEDSWAIVDLFLWQYGELPKEGDNRKVSVPLALIGMADAISKKDMKHFPNPMNVEVCLRYAAKYMIAHGAI